MTLCAILNLKEHGGRQEKLYLTKAAELETRETQRKDYGIFQTFLREIGELVSFVLW